jgi:hypothetical protein
MKKLVIGAAALACASIVSAQTVTSANIVGYNKDVSPASSFHIAGVQFATSGTSPTAVFGAQLPLGTKIYVFNGATYSTSTYITDYDDDFNEIQRWDNDAIELGSAVGFWVQNTGASQAEAIISGNVPLELTISKAISTGFQLISYPYPVAQKVKDMEFTPTLGDKIYVFNGSTYNTATFIEDYDDDFNLIQVWDNPDLTVQVGQGFWYEAEEPMQWVVNRPFSL